MVSVVAVVLIGWAGWLLTGLTFETDSTATGVGVALVAFPTFLLALAISRAQDAQKLEWFIAVFGGLVGSSFLLGLLTAALVDFKVR